MPPEESRQGCAGDREGPGPGDPQQSPLHSRPLPVTLQSPLRRLNPSLLRLGRPDRQLDPDPGPFGPRATGLRTGEAAGVWKTPAAYIGRRPGVSDPEGAAFVRELEEARCPDRPPVSVKKISQEDVRVMLNLLEELFLSVWEIPETKTTFLMGGGVPLQRKRDLNTAARVGQSLVKQNSVLMEENSKLEGMLGSARQESDFTP
ncbi:hypothetical protein mRhiFer1_006193 [Rhinolophus ferrumequinum]|uniref:HAP1 N-terminal domain-containing protein n=1 Tax=Rhinolophus ferrumequinum TaxID=59479 RepID=A0A7J7TD19_RHIFE|nr:hypothetical protein mRhiFer1_006193 [Rhinolophus ferrumequinum]